MARKKPVILCVDDEKIILDALEEQISSRLGDDFDIELAESGEEALEIIDELDEEGIDLAIVISDHLMPGMKGDEFLIKVHQKHPDTIKILLTGQAGIEAVQKAINEARLYRYLSKPWEENDLLLTIEEAAKYYNQYQELRKYNRLLRKLNEATQELSGLATSKELKELLRKVLDSAIETVSAERGFLLLQDGKALKLEAFFSMNKEELNKILYAYNKDPNRTVQTIMNYVMKALEGPEEKDTRFVTRIYRKGKTLGYLYLDNPYSNEVIDNVQKEILRMLAANAAISLENYFLYKNVEEERRKVMESLATINESLHYARKIQYAILPNLGLLKNDFPESFVFYKPLQVVSGDFYWFTEEEDHYVIAAVDCTGHGVPGAFMSVLGSNLLNYVVKELKILEPSAILETLDKSVREALRRENKPDDNEKVRDGMELALVVIDKNERKLHFAGAVRPLVLIRQGELIYTKGTFRPIGGDELGERSVPYQVHTFDIQIDDIIYLYSDGVTDQFGGDPKKPRKFSSRRFKNLLLEISDKPMSEQEKIIEQTIEKWRKSANEEQTDDLMVIGVKFTEDSWVFI